MNRDKPKRKKPISAIIICVTFQPKNTIKAKTTTRHSTQNSFKVINVFRKHFNGKLKIYCVFQVSYCGAFRELSKSKTLCLRETPYTNVNLDEINAKNQRCK